MRAFTNRAGEASGTFFGEAGARKWSGWSSLRGPERNELCPRAGAEGRLEAIFRAYQAGKQKQPFFFPYKTEITSAREKLLAQRRRREGVYQPSSRSKSDFSRRSRHKGAGGWSPYRGPEHSGLCVCEGGSGIPVLARRRYLYFLPWVGARECRPRVSGGN